MKKLAIAIFPWLFAFGSFNASAQVKIEKEKKGEKTEIQEIIIKKKGEKDQTVTITFKGEDVLINDKPISEFEKDGDLTVNKRKMIITNGLGDLQLRMEGLSDRLEGLNFGGDNFAFGSPGIDSDKDNKSPFLGVSTEEDKNAVLITNVTPKSAADEAGLKKGDLVYKINGDKVETPKDLSKIIEGRKVDDKVRVYFKRDGKKMDVEATLKSRGNSLARSYSFSSPQGGLKSFSFPQMPDMEKYEFNYDGNIFSNNQKLGLRIKDTEGGKGVSVEDVDEDSNAAKAGFKKGDILTELDGEKINDTNDARTALKKVSKASAYNAKVLRNGKEVKLEVKIVKPLKEINL